MLAKLQYDQSNAVEKRQRIDQRVREDLNYSSPLNNPLFPDYSRLEHTPLQYNSAPLILNNPGPNVTANPCCITGPSVDDMAVFELLIASLFSHLCAS